MKKLVKKILQKAGYDIRKNRNSFFENPKIDWFRDYDFDLIIDVGANEGQFTLMINGIFPDATIYSFEPIRDSFEKLKRNTQRIQRIFSFNFALGDNNGEMNFYVNDFSPSSSFMETKDLTIKNFPFTSNQKLSKVEIKMLDDVLVNVRPTGAVLLKIDVQGYELNVLLGGRTFIESYTPIIIVEVSYKELYKGGATFENIYDYLRDFGYEFIGNLNQLYSPIDGSILQSDAVFKKRSDT